jgi:DNA (cytosine-5)-methyltransferase 1
MTLTYGSVCSGIEAASVAWSPLGWQCRFVSEIEKFPCAVLKHHFPSVPNFGDMTKFLEWPDEQIDVLVGGTPCQSFSVAGLRRGLADPRGNLALVYLGILDKYRPSWCVWENVPGVLSSNGGRDFGAFLGALGQLGYGFTYRVLDAQHFGVPQRRRRVFVVGHLGDWRRAAAVLFERESLSRYPTEGRKDGEGDSPALDGCIGARTVALRGREGGATAELGSTVATALRASQGGGDKPYILTDRVRRLSPVECERLQGFPDDWTKVTAATKDGPRYKAIGNSMAVPVMRWIGEGIAAVSSLSP